MFKQKAHYYIFIILSCIVIFLAKDFPGNRGSSYTMGPGFFPIFVSAIFIFLSLIGIFRKEKKNEEKVGQFRDVAFVTVLLVFCVLLIQYIHFLLGIFVLLLGFLICIAQLEFKKALFISVLGSVGIAVPVLLLGIPI